MGGGGSGSAAAIKRDEGDSARLEDGDAVLGGRGGGVEMVLSALLHIWLCFITLPGNKTFYSVTFMKPELFNGGGGLHPII